MANQLLTDRFNTGTTAVYTPGTQAGIVPATGLPGATAGTTVAAGVVGEKITGTKFTPSLVTGTRGKVGSVDLTPGVWLIYGSGGITGSPTGVTRTYIEIANDVAGTVQYTMSEVPTASNAGGNVFLSVTGPIVVGVSSTVYFNVACSFTGGSAAGGMPFVPFAIRIG